MGHRFTRYFFLLYKKSRLIIILYRKNILIELVSVITNYINRSNIIKKLTFDIKALIIIADTKIFE